MPGTALNLNPMVMAMAMVTAMAIALAIATTSNATRVHPIAVTPGLLMPMVVLLEVAEVAMSQAATGEPINQGPGAVLHHQMALKLFAAMARPTSGVPSAVSGTQPMILQPIAGSLLAVSEPIPVLNAMMLQLQLTLPLTLLLGSCFPIAILPLKLILKMTLSL